MTSIQQRADLQAQIWKIFNDVRGSIDGWDFKQYVLCTLFYRSISQNSASGYPSEMEIKGLFANFDTTSNRLCNTVKDKNSRLAAVLNGVAGLNFGDFQDNHIAQIMEAFEHKIDVPYFAKSVDFETIEANDYNLSVSSYVVSEDTREVINITKLNSELKITVAKIDRLCAEIELLLSLRGNKGG